MRVQQVVRDARHTGQACPGAGGLADSLRRVDELQSRIELRTGRPGDGRWRRCCDLLETPYLFTRWRADLATWLSARHGVAPARTTASYVASWYLRVPAYVGALLLHHERRVPALRPEELTLRVAAEGRPNPDGVAVLGESFYCLPSDPGSALPEATVVADDRALAAVLRARYTAHAARFVQAYREVSPLGPRALWAAATDALDSCLWWAGLDGGDEGSGVADAALVLESRFAPLTSASTLCTVAATDGHREWTRSRESCCFSYLLPERAECAGCPRVRGDGRCRARKPPLDGFAFP